MRRTRSHIIETESENIFRNSLPSEWIIRKIETDYGVDYEVEIVDVEVVTGNRFWVQLKGTRAINIRKNKLNAEYIAYRVNPNLLEYALRCSYPLLICIVDVSDPEVYWMPLRNWITARLDNINFNWRNQGSVTVRIPSSNTFTHEATSDHYGLLWFAMEPARMYSFATLATYNHELQYRCSLSGYSIGEGFIDNG